MQTRDPTPSRSAVLTSGAAYAAAFLTTTVLHELAHFVVSAGFGRSPVQGLFVLWMTYPGFVALSLLVLRPGVSLG